MPGLKELTSINFIKKVNFENFDKTKCWEWQGAGKGNGYGNFNNHGKSTQAHRFSYMLFKGISEIPKGFDVCHSCDNRACVNPYHLFLGTRKDNMQDAKNKNRLSTGEKHSLSTKRRSLGSEKAKRAREMSKSGMSNKQIGEVFGVNASSIWAIVNNKTYTYLED